MDISDILTTIVVPAATAIVGWLAKAKKDARDRKREDNEFLKNMQESINLLAEENKKLMQQVIELRKENAVLKAKIEELNIKLENVKTITRKS
jgi:predicted RNase H-like nuclease (RuvC/YqgF family)